MSLIEKDTIDGIIAISIGCLVIIFRKPFAREIIEGQNRVFGFHFGQKEIKTSEHVIIIGGLLIILFGLMDLGLFDFFVLGH